MNSKIQNLSSTVTEKLEPLLKANPFTQQKNSSDNKKEKDYFTQSLIDIEDMVGGLIITRTGSIIKILEVLPLNYDEYDASVKDNIASIFGYGLKRCPKSGHIKIMRSSADITPFVNNVRAIMADETDENLKKRVDDYLNHTIKLQESNTIKNRFFFIFEYEGDSRGKKSSVWSEIYEQMAQTSYDVVNALSAAGNYVIDYGSNRNMELLNILYSHYNPSTSKKEPLRDRVNKVTSAANYVKEHGRKSVTPPITDYIAPRGLHFGKYDYCVQDGVFHTYMALRDDSYPLQVYAGQLTQHLMAGLEDCDLDIYYRIKPREATLYLLDRTNVISKGVARSFQGDDDKVEALTSSASNAKYIKDCMIERDEELYDVFTILTVRAASLKELRFQTEAYIKKMKASSFYFDSCFMKTQEYWKMVQPTMYINNLIFKDNARNMPNSSFAALYPFTSFEMFDPNGVVMGKTVTNNTLFSIDNFDSKRYPNPHMFLIGTTGAGKTFTIDMLTSRMRMHGDRIIYILPLKGHEYKRCVSSLGGEFITLRPGEETCINILEIRPEGVADLSGMDEDELEELKNQPSLMAKKITSIITWLRLLVKDDPFDSEEIGEINELLTNLYSKYGITNDNESIWEDESHTQTKKMPILKDLYEAMREHKDLSRRSSVLKTWVSGSCSNMNGQTNVDLTNMCIAFDINEDYIGEELLPAFMYIAFDCGYDLCKRDEEEKCAIVLDEVWKLLKIPACASQVFKMVKILRAYNSASITATQDIEDCLGNEYGKAILTNSAIKIFLKVTLEEFEIIARSVKFSESNKNSILNSPRGRGFITFNTDRLFIDFKASEYEEYLYTTDAKRRKELKGILQKKGIL